MMYKATTRITSLLDAQTLAEEKAKAQRPARTFHASSTQDCQRQQVYDRLGYPKAWTNPKAQWIHSREAGNLLHGYYVDILRRSGLVLDSETPIPINDEEIGGRYDISFYIESQKVVVDIKSVDHEKFKEVPKGDKFRDNYVQVQMYLHYLGLEEGILLYVNRSTNELKEFTVYHDGAVIEDTLGRVKRMGWYLKNRVIPKPEYSFKCRFCPFLAICEIDGNKEVKLDDEDSLQTPQA